MGFFVLMAMLYPFFISALIAYEDFKKSSQEMNTMRKTYRLLVGLEECSIPKAEEVAPFMSGELLSKLGGVKGLVRLCMKERGSSKVVAVKEDFSQEGSVFRLVALLKRREKGVAKAFKSVSVVAVEDSRGFRIIDVKINRL